MAKIGNWLELMDIISKPGMTHSRITHHNYSFLYAEEFAKWEEEYGKIFGLYMLRKPMLVITNRYI